MHAIILTSMLVGFAPAPAAKPMPMTPAERQALLESALEEMRLARNEAAPARDRQDDDTTANKDFVRLNRSAAEKLSRLHDHMDKDDFLRISVGMQAGRAWKLSGDDAKAAVFFEWVVRETSDARWRLQALGQARSSYDRAKQPAKAKGALDRMKVEVKKLTGKDKEDWEKRISRIK